MGGGGGTGFIGGGTMPTGGGGRGIIPRAAGPPVGGNGGGGRLDGGTGAGVGCGKSVAGCGGITLGPPPPGPPLPSLSFLKANCRKNSLVSLFHSDQNLPSDLSTSRDGTYEMNYANYIVET